MYSQLFAASVVRSAHRSANAWKLSASISTTFITSPNAQQRLSKLHYIPSPRKIAPKSQFGSGSGSAPAALRLDGPVMNRMRHSPHSSSKRHTLGSSHETLRTLSFWRGLPGCLQICFIFRTVQVQKSRRY